MYDSNSDLKPIGIINDITKKVPKDGPCVNPALVNSNQKYCDYQVPGIPTPTTSDFPGYTTYNYGQMAIQQQISNGISNSNLYQQQQHYHPRTPTSYYTIVIPAFPPPNWYDNQNR